MVSAIVSADGCYKHGVAPLGRCVASGALWRRWASGWGGRLRSLLVGGETGKGTQVGGGPVRGMGRTDCGWQPPSPENPGGAYEGSLGKDGRSCGSRRWPENLALLGFPTATLGGGPDPQETPRLELSLDVQMAGELDHVVLMVLPCFIKCPNKQASQAHSVLFTAAIISLTSRLI